MFIQTEETPNPATLKFLPGKPVMDRGTANYVNADEAAGSPLATRMFGVEGVEGVFLGADFITATKTGEADWNTIKPHVLSAIMDHFTSGEPVVHQSVVEADGSNGEDDSEIVVQIKELLDTRVRPAVAQDGGDIVFQGFEDGVVYLHMQGACAGCPSSTATLKYGIENMLRYYLPEVREVRPVE